MSNINFFFKGQALVLENLSLPVILGVDFLKTNSLSPIFHTPSQQVQMLIANVSSGNFQKNKSPSRSRPEIRTKSQTVLKFLPPPVNSKPPPPPDFESAVDGAPLLLVQSVTWKRLNTETPQHGNASKKRTHKTNLMSSSLIKKKYVNNYFTINLG